nr:immunoglobulin light chain junction region [Macaca mulatta]MPN94157.1 immunoglobulin light chain junction region [Macaca mulatta]MPN94459.1 immunoglobulin light chain junction region [Macaca mulatta]MPN97162.1 immunoglobulin light chain junction region [Macaca mulatta]MPN97490.1 immunoglobulin light chain junction region [Macaca mulatta]
CQHYYSTPYSV